MAELTLTDQNFELEVMKEAAMPVLVDFWATWCGPCKAQAPIINEIAKEYDGKVKVGGVDVDGNPRTTMKYSILSIPTLMLFKNGKPVWQGVGMHSKKQLDDILKDSLK
ncbi:MAG: thioredoxin [Candidatus Kerfeldbacteria bacterium]